MSEDVFTLNTQVQAVIERAKEDARVLRDGSFRDNAMQVIVELDSRLRRAEEAQQAAYERGKTEGAREERARIREALKAERDSVKQRKERSKSAWFGLVWQEREETYDKAIAIVNQE